MPVCAHELNPSGLNSYQYVTGDDSEGDRGSWDQFFRADRYIYGKEPAQFLQRNIGYLKPGRVLDLAMGEGRNAVFLAKKGFYVEGVDISEVALRKAKRLARENGVSIATVLADLNRYSIKPDYYNVILNFDYLQKNIISQIKRGLKKDGVVVFENFTLEQLTIQSDQNMSRDYLLKKGQLRELFNDFEIITYQETNNGREAKASLIARKK